MQEIEKKFLPPNMAKFCKKYGIIPFRYRWIKDLSEKSGVKEKTIQAWIERDMSAQAIIEHLHNAVNGGQVPNLESQLQESIRKNEELKERIRSLEGRLQQSEGFADKLMDRLFKINPLYEANKAEFLKKMREKSDMLNKGSVS